MESGRSLPDAELLARELRLVVSVGCQPTPLSQVADRLPRLSSLDCVAKAALDRGADHYQVARALVAALAAVVRRLGGGPLGLAVGYLLGLDPESRGLSAERRRELAISELFDEGMSAVSFQRRHQDHVLVAVADELCAYEDEYRVRQARIGLEIADVQSERLAIDWLRRFEYYYGMWSALSGLRNDLQTAMERRVRDGQDPAETPYARSSLWYYAQFLVRLERFVQERGGLWLLSSIDAEAEVAQAVYWVRWHTSMADIDDSWLRRHLLAAEELEPFAEHLQDDERGRDIRARWAGFLRDCHCALSDPAADCQLHLVMEWCDRYTNTIDAEWARIAPWYQSGPDERTAGRVELGAVFDVFPYVLGDSASSQGGGD